MPGLGTASRGHRGGWGGGGVQGLSQMIKEIIKNLSINDRLHEIKSTRGTTYDIKITQDMQEGEWIISLHTKIEHLLKKTGFNQTRILLFTITKKNDPNVLYRRIELNLLDLVYNGAIKIPYEHNWEREMSTVSIYTNKYFDDYKSLT